jgi:hypothetical protein
MFWCHSIDHILYVCFAALTFTSPSSYEAGDVLAVVFNALVYVYYALVGWYACVFVPFQFDAFFPFRYSPSLDDSSLDLLPF